MQVSVGQLPEKPYLLVPLGGWNPNTVYYIKMPPSKRTPVYQAVLYSGDRYQGPVKLEEDIPILGDIGFSRFYSPEKAYVTINSFIENVLRENLDTVPPVEVDNKQKILAAGFDLKTSFRNPIK